ncbi:double-stranded RNA-binding protein Staufen homolog isoform X2 [Gigantopelta aegis]|uniref:double-stranded RNA-binding protein Staufen homolog isoform X2 n=1 Tax=Gigantopelta aegis TaxID=1735272 RepID=UPI001B88981B|nr:double-stranded RNA-binding protein Staufen homolog isoform X2 [Gigantopelta aegis]
MSQLMKSSMNNAVAAVEQHMAMPQSGPAIKVLSHHPGFPDSGPSRQTLQGMATSPVGLSHPSGLPNVQPGLAHSQPLRASFAPKPLKALGTTPQVTQNGLGHPGLPVSSSIAASINSENIQQQQQQQQQQEQQQELSEQSSMANTKEKTPMCLINELARYCKISHQYTLVNEEGPAHKKTFYVKLRLGEEEYSASGPSIKKAQHSAAAMALDKTSFNHPPQKTSTSQNTTMELNALAMKRGEPAVYKPHEPRHSQYYQPPNFDYRGMYNQRYHYGRIPRTFYILLKVGQREFIGDGPTRQAARHSAAQKALRILRTLSMPTEDERKQQKEKEENGVNEDDELKSEISLVHEIALKRSMPVDFEVTKESGPPHMKVFVTKCTVGDFVTEAEGNSKKISKKRAAELMLEKLKKLPQLSISMTKPKVKAAANNKRKNRNLVKLSDSLILQQQAVGADGSLTTSPDGAQNQNQKPDSNFGLGMNPISLLIQIMQAHKKKEPVYSLVAERGLPRRREFVIQVQVEDKSCTGVGPNKKLAKRNAAEAMLHLLGFSRPSPQPAKSAIKTNASPDVGTGDKKVTFVDNSTENNGALGGLNMKTGRQLVPGLLLIPQSGIGAAVPGLRPEQQLQDLATRHQIDVHFEESAKNQTVYVTSVSLRTSPPQMVHGTGVTLDASRDAAALSAIKVFTDMGLAGMKDEKMAGDGHHVKADMTNIGPHPTMAGAAAHLSKIG